MWAKIIGWLIVIAAGLVGTGWFFPNYAEWATVFAELLIAAAILYELEENRRNNFFTEAADRKNYQARGKVYSAFFETEGNCVEDKSRKFCEQVWKDVKLKRQCERHILLFGRLEQIRRHALVRRSEYVRLFPHTVVLFWIMLQPYIEERRALTGEWWATDFIDLTERCLSYLLEKPDRKLWLYDSDRTRKKDLEISTDNLRRVQDSLRAMRACK
jgi:hypothetical protein